MDRQTPFERVRGAIRRAFFWLPSAQPDEEKQREHGHDHALVLSVTAPERVPRWRALRNIPRLFTSSERRMFLIAGVVTALALGAALVAFVSSRTVTVPVVGGTFTEGVVGTPQHLNPLDATGNDVDADLTRLIFSGLFRFKGLDAVPDLADQYAWSQDGKTLTVHLRDDARFHDGEPLTSEDVRFTIESAKDPSRKSAFLSAFHDVTVATPDDRTAVFTLTRPDPTLLQKLTIGILPAHLWQDIPANTARLSDLNLKPVGAGPYRLKSFLRDTQGNIYSYTLERFDNAAGIRPFLQTLVYRFFPSRTEAVDALKGDLVDALAFVNAAEATTLRSARLHDVHLELPQETVAFFNVKDDVLAKKEVRQALALAVNRQEIVDAERGSAIAVSGPYPFGPATTTTPDLEGARSLLTQAGWALPDAGGVRIWKPVAKKVESQKSKVKSRLTTPDARLPTPAVSSTELALTITAANEPELVAVAESLKRAWSLLGMRITIDAVATDELMRRATRDRTTQVVILNVLLGPDQDIFPFWWSGQAVDRGLNFSNFRDRTVDDALDAVHAASSTDAIAKAQLAAAQTIQQSIPAVFLARPVQHYFVSTKVKGIPDRSVIATPAERFDSIETWYVNTGWRWK